MNVCALVFVLSLVMGPGTVIANPGGLAEPGSASAAIELGAAVSILDLSKSIRNFHRLSDNGYCGYVLRLGYRWKDYLLLEGEYDHFVDRTESHVQSLFLAGPRVGFRKRGLGAYIKLQPGMLRAVKFDPSDTRSRFALSAGGVLEAYVKPHAYVRFDLAYLVIWFGDATPRHPHFSIGFGFRL